MRAIVLSFMHPDIVPGGAQQVAYNLHLGLMRAGHQSFFTAFHDKLPARLVSDATPIVKMPQRLNEYIVNVAGFDYDRFVSCNRWVLEAYVRFVKGINPDIIFVHHFMLAGIDFLVALRKAFPRSRFVFTAHEFLPICKRDGHLVRSNGQLCTSYTPFDCIGCFPHSEPKDFSVRFRMFQRLFDVCDVVITPSAFQGQIMASHFAFGDRLAVVPNGSFDVVSHAYNGASRRGRGETVAYFGQVLRDKGIGFLLHQIPALFASRKQVKVDIWGSGLDMNGPGFQKSVAQAVELIGGSFGSDRLTLKGSYDNRRVVEMMSLYDVVIFPSLWPETFSMVFSEALIAGCKIVAPSLGAYKERVAEVGENAYLYTLGDTLSFSVAVNAALSTPYKPLSETAGEQLSVDAMTQGYLAAGMLRVLDTGTPIVAPDLAELEDVQSRVLDDEQWSPPADLDDEDDEEPAMVLSFDDHDRLFDAGDDIAIPEEGEAMAPAPVSEEPTQPRRRPIAPLDLPMPDVARRAEPVHNPFASAAARNAPAPALPIDAAAAARRVRRKEEGETEGGGKPSRSYRK